MTISVEFVDNLPPEKRQESGRAEYRLFAAALRERPGVWAKWPLPIKDTTARGYASQIRSGMIAAFRGGQYDAVYREGTLFVRYLGEQS